MRVDIDKECLICATSSPARGLPFSAYTPKGRGRVSQISYTFSLRIAHTHTQKKGGGVQIACKIVFILNGRPPTLTKLIKCKWIKLELHKIAWCATTVKEIADNFVCIYYTI